MTLPQNQHGEAKFDKLQRKKEEKKRNEVENISGKCTQHTTRGTGDGRGRQSCQVCCLLSASAQ